MTLTCLSKRSYIRFIIKHKQYISLKEYRRRMRAVVVLSKEHPTTIELTNGTIVTAKSNPYWRIT